MECGSCGPLGLRGSLLKKQQGLTKIYKPSGTGCKWFCKCMWSLAGFADWKLLMVLLNGLGRFCWCWNFLDQPRGSSKAALASYAPSHCRTEGYPLCKLCTLPGCRPATALEGSGQPILLDATPLWRWLPLIFLPPSRVMWERSTQWCLFISEQCCPKLPLTQKAALVAPESASGWRQHQVGDAQDVDLRMLGFQEVLCNAPVLFNSPTLWKSKQPWQQNVPIGS